MRLTSLIAVARRRASTLDYDATRWHRIECKAREALRRRAAAKRRLERKTSVAIPVTLTDEFPLDEDDTETLTERQTNHATRS